jgi:HTH-type transcriptional regulator / antitoxin HipB
MSHFYDALKAGKDASRKTSSLTEFTRQLSIDPPSLRPRLICNIILIVNNHINKRISARLGLPAEMRRQLRDERRKKGWSQAELGKRSGLPQMHISGIESGKIVPRFDTLLDLVRILGYDLLLVPRALVPATQSLMCEGGTSSGERPLYAAEDYEPGSEQERNDEV